MFFKYNFKKYYIIYQVKKRKYRHYNNLPLDYITNSN